MGLLTRAAGWLRAITWNKAKSAGLLAPATRSGHAVTEKTSLQLSALYCGLRSISEAVGMMPVHLYGKDKNNERNRATTHPLYSLLHDSPNGEHTRPVFFETLQCHALLHGGAFAEIERAGSGRAIALWPIHPTRVKPIRGADGKLAYLVDSMPGEPPVTLAASDVLHVPGLSPDGVNGYKLLEVGRETIGYALAAQAFGASWFKNAGRPGGVLTVEGTLSEEARTNLRRSWQQLHAGVDNAGAVAVLEEGTKWQGMTATNEQGQYLGLMGFIIYEVARLLNIPPSKLWSLEKATWGNLETLNQDFLTTTLQPWLSKWEAELNKKLLTEGERGAYYFEFLPDVILRTSYQVRTDGQVKECGGPYRTVNEIRRQNNQPPIDGGDVLRSGGVTVPTTNETDTKPNQEKPTDGE